MSEIEIGWVVWALGYFRAFQGYHLILITNHGGISVGFVIRGCMRRLKVTARALPSVDPLLSVSNQEAGKRFTRKLIDGCLCTFRRRDDNEILPIERKPNRVSEHRLVWAGSRSLTSYTTHKSLFLPTIHQGEILVSSVPA